MWKKLKFDKYYIQVIAIYRLNVWEIVGKTPRILNFGSSVWLK
jgi:hypothetical protein